MTPSSSRSRPSSKAPPVHEFAAGEKIGRYLLVEQVGQGGMGVVFSAFDPQLNRKVALKILRASQTEGADKQELRNRLFREAQAIAKLSHPNVITVFDVGTVGASVFVAMEFVEGVTLTEYLHKPRTLEAIVAAFAQAGRGLSAAHQAGLVHRDFKPDNVLMGFDGIARVSDFGLARSDPSLVGDEEDEPEFISSPGDMDQADLLSSPMTQAGAVVGTPRFMAPEQHAGAPPDPRSDQFAFCVALYQALYGQEPFIAHTMEQLVEHKQQGRVREPPEISEVPGRLEQLVWRGLSPDPRRRYASMEALLEDLHAEYLGRSRPVLRWVVGLGLSAAALGIAALQSSDAPRLACDEGRTRWDEIWSVGRKAAIEVAFMAAEPDAEASTWPRVERDLDAYGEAFVGAYAAACDAAGGPRPSEDMFFQLRRACLMERRDFAAALIDLFEAPDPALVRSAPQAIAELPEIARCSEVAGLLARGMPTPLEETPAATEFREALMQARVLGVAGRYAAANARATDALHQAESLGFGEFTAEAHLVLGRALAEGGRYAESEPHLREAFLGGMRVAHDQAAAEAAIALVEVLGVRLEHHQEAALWEAQASALLDRIDDQGILRARLQNRAGRLDARAGAYEAARAHHAAALKLRATARGDDDPGRADWLIDLGNVALAQRAFDEAVETFDRALALAETTLPTSHPTRADALAALGRVHLHREEYGPAKDALAQARVGLESSFGPEHPTTALVVLGIAMADEGLGELAAAEDGYAQAADLLLVTFGRGHASYRRALLGQARCARRDARIGDAAAWYERACGGPALPPSLEGECLLENGWQLLDAERFAGATRSFDDAVRTFAAGPFEDPRYRAEALLGLARTRLRARDFDGAAQALAKARNAATAVQGYVPSVRSDLDELSTSVAAAMAEAEPQAARIAPGG